MNLIEKTFRESFNPPDRRSIVDWLSDNVKFGPESSMPGRFDPRNMPWNNRFYEAYQNPNVKEVLYSGSPQEMGKTTAAFNVLAWQAVNDPALMGFYSDTNTKIKDMFNTKWRPIQKNCDALGDAILKNAGMMTTMKDGTSITFLGAESEANRQSYTMRVIVKDEDFLYRAGWDDEINNRAKSFERTDNFKIISLGTGGTVGTHFHKQHTLGTQEVYEVPCEHCGGFYQYKWDKKNGGVFRYDEVFRESDGELDYKASAKTVRIECPHCKGEIRYSRDSQRRAALQGRWRVTNPDADGRIVSLTAPAFIAGANWADFVEDWLRVNNGRKLGKKEALKEIIMKRLAEFWSDFAIVEKKDLPYGNYSRQEMLDGKWSDEIVRIATVDYQHGMRGDRQHFYFVVRAISRQGESRLVDCGRVDEAAELDTRLQRAGVVRVDRQNHMHSRVMIDCAASSNSVYELCARFVWLGIRGEDRDTKNKGGQFPHKIQSGNTAVTVWKNYSEIKHMELGVGKRSAYRGYVPTFHINNQAIEEQLYELRTGKAMDWTVPNDIDEWCPEYAAHINSHIYEEGRWKLAGNSENNPDHLYDCEKYQVGAALRAGLMATAQDEADDSRA